MNGVLATGCNIRIENSIRPDIYLSTARNGRIVYVSQRRNLKLAIGKRNGAVIDQSRSLYFQNFGYVIFNRRYCSVIDHGQSG